MILSKIKTQNSHHKAIGISVIVAVLVVLAVLFAISQMAGRNDTDNQASVQQASQAQCLNDAYTAYEKSWKDADKDGDGSLSFQDGATNITTSYYDAAIACCRTNKTADSNDYIADYQTERQQEVDKYTAWLEASRQPTHVQTPSNSYSSGMNCTSNSIGSSTYARCY